MKTSGYWIAGPLLAAFATASSAQDAPFCDRLDQALAATTGDDAQADAVMNILSGLGSSPAACSFSLGMSGVKSANCHWAFSYRSDQATQAFAAMLQALSACADPASVIETDQPVNHPDFYDLRLLRVKGAEVGLSLKDKISLQQTYVFLRLTPTP